MPWEPRDLVAALLAASVFAFFVGGLVARVLWHETGIIADAAVLEAWVTIMNVIIGALAGYIGGSKK